MKIGDFAVVTKDSQFFYEGRLGRVKDAIHDKYLSGYKFGKTQLLFADDGRLYVCRFLPLQYALTGNTPEEIERFYASLKHPDRSAGFDINRALERALREYNILLGADLQAEYPEKTIIEGPTEEEFNREVRPFMEAFERAKKEGEKSQIQLLEV